MVDRLLPEQIEGLPQSASQGTAPCALVLGEGSAASLAQARALGGKTEIAPIPELTAELLARLRPEWVIFALIEGRFDAPHVIETLAILGYTGRACVLAPILPNRRMVEVELRAIYPTLNLLLIETPE